jgi:hypothetical protein
MTSPRPVPIFDGHNDVLLRLYRRGGTDVSRAFLEGEAKGQLEIFGPVLVVERRIDAAHAQVSETIQPWMRDLRHRNAEPVGPAWARIARVAALLAQGRRVRILDLRPPTCARTAAQYVAGSVLDSELVREALDDVGEVYHLAALRACGYRARMTFMP